MIGRRGAPALAGAVALVAYGCVGFLGGEDDPEFLGEEPAQVRVINDNFYDVTVYADYDGHRERMGRVVGHTTETFEITARTGARVAIAVAVQAGRTHLTERITIDPGDEIEVRVPPDLDRR